MEDLSVVGGFARVKRSGPPARRGLLKRCGWTVDSLWTLGAPKYILRAVAAENAGLHSVGAPSIVLSLEGAGRPARMQPHSILNRTSGDGIDVNVHRFEETINGRDYLIEVSSVGTDKWRAQIARIPGGSVALMPFYGKTPDEAARQLSRWLLIAHGQADSRRTGRG